MYWESRGRGGVPLIMVHGGYGWIGTFGLLLDELARDRQVIGIELQGHAHTADIDRPFSWAAFGDDIAALIRHLGLTEADVLGLSLGGGASLRG
jgi:pimeloyl-ACP methyl ester carboxylesterase